MRRSLRVSAFLFFFYALTSFNSFFFFVHNILPKFATSNCYGGYSGSSLKRLEILRAFVLPDYIRNIQATAYLQPFSKLDPSSVSVAV